MALASPEIARKRESIVRAHVDAENRHDASGVVSTFHQPKYEVMPLGAVLDGAQPVSDFLGGVFEGFPDFAAHVPSFVHADLGIIAEGRLRVRTSMIGPVFQQQGAPLTSRFARSSFSKKTD